MSSLFILPSLPCSSPSSALSTSILLYVPPFVSGAHSLTSRRPLSSSDNVVTLNIGGQIFQTTRQTLAIAGPTSLLSNPPPFLNRDPHLFSPLLSLLCFGHLPNPNPNPNLTDLIAEAQFYDIDPSLLSSSSSSSPQFDAFDLSPTLTLPPIGRDQISAVHVSPSSSVHVAHGGKITSFDFSLSTKSATLTKIFVVNSLLTLTPNLFSAGTVD